MRNYKITNIDTKVIQHFNYNELQQFMRINRKNFFNKYTIKEIIKSTPIEQKILLSILFLACSLVLGVMILETFVFLTN
tara:strand:- start:213 stop:449 length:237 start_codon:yes stop_codon:yes gene_type:complete